MKKTAITVTKTAIPISQYQLSAWGMKRFIVFFIASFKNKAAVKPKAAVTSVNNCLLNSFWKSFVNSFVDSLLFFNSSSSLFTLFKFTAIFPSPSVQWKARLERRTLEQVSPPWLRLGSREHSLLCLELLLPPWLGLQ